MASVSQAFEPSRDLRVLLKDLLRQVVKPKTADDRGIKEEAALGAIDGLDDNGLAKRLEELLADKRYIIHIELRLSAPRSAKPIGTLGIPFQLVHRGTTKQPLSLSSSQ